MVITIITTKHAQDMFSARATVVIDDCTFRNKTDVAPTEDEAAYDALSWVVTEFLPDGVFTDNGFQRKLL